MVTVLKPKRSVYLNYHFGVTAAILASVLAFAFLLFRSFSTEAIPSWVWAVASGVSFLLLMYRWVFLSRSLAKTEYHIHNDRIVVRGGGIFSQFEQELIAQNVTHVQMKKPFPEFALCQTGHVYVQSAGGADVEVNMRSLENPEEAYQTILSWLKQNGFHLGQDKLIHEAAPARRGVLLMVAGGSFGTLVGGGIFLAGILQDGAKQPLKILWGWPAFVLVGLLVVGGVATAVFSYGYLLRRRYQLYENVIISETNFWVKEVALIPTQNLSDSALTQGLVARVLGLHDLLLSCQGSGHEISFKTLDNGALWKEKLDQLMEKRAQANVQARQEAKVQQQGWGPKSLAKDVVRDESSTAELSLHRKRMMLPPTIAVILGFVLVVIGFALLPPEKLSEKPKIGDLLAWILFATGGLSMFFGGLNWVYSYIYGKAYQFSIKASSFASSLQFVVQRKVEFQTEKVTAVIVREGIIDRWFGTCSVEFWSIGASDHLRFRFIRKDDELLHMILNKVGIHPEPEAKQRVVGSNADPLRMMQVGGLFFGPVLLSSPLLAMWVHWTAGVAALAVVAMPMVLSKVYYNFHQLTLFEDYLWFRKGVVQHVHYYVHYNDVKYVASTKYPFSTSGTLRFEITGERVIKTDNGEFKVSNRFSVRFVPDVRFQHLVMDLLLDGRTDWDKLPLSTTHPDSFKARVLSSTGPQFFQAFVTRGAALFVLDALLAIGLVVLSFQDTKTLPQLASLPSVGWITLLAVNVLVILYLFMYVRSIRYILDEQKVTMESGILFHKQLAIHFQDMDFIGKKFGVANKLFGTGNITINTVGSSATDLTLKNLSDVEAFYSMLKDHYQGKPVEPDT